MEHDIHYGLDFPAIQECQRAGGLSGNFSPVTLMECVSKRICGLLSD